MVLVTRQQCCALSNRQATNPAASHPMPSGRWRMGDRQVSDIAERLRDCYTGCPSAITTAPVALLREAADEIERLRAERDAYRGGYEYLQGRLRSIGYDGWARDQDDMIERAAAGGSSECS